MPNVYDILNMPLREDMLVDDPRMIYASMGSEYEAPDDPRTLSRRIQEIVGAQKPNEGGLAAQILSQRFQPTFDDVSRAGVETLRSGKFVSGQDYADQRLSQAMERFKSLQQQEMENKRFSLQERQFEENMRSNRANEAIASQRVSSGGSGLAGTGVERMRDWYISQGVPPLEAASLAQKGAGVGNAYIPGQGIVPIANSKSLDTLDQSISAIDRVISSPGLGARTGYSSILPSKMQGYAATATQARIDQLKGMGFLDAYNALKGGGQITEVEGIKATQARIRLEQATSQDEFIDALKEWQAIQIQIRDRMRNQLAGNNPPSGSDMPQFNGYQTPGFNPQEQQPYATPGQNIINWEDLP